MMSAHRFIMFIMMFMFSTTTATSTFCQMPQPWQENIWVSESSKRCSEEQMLHVGQTLLENGSELDDCVPVDLQEMVEHEVPFDIVTTENEPFMHLCRYKTCRQVIKDTFEKLLPAENCFINIHPDGDEEQDEENMVTVDFHHLFGKIMGLCRML